MTTFNELRLDNQVIRAISNMGFEETTPIQEKTIPFVMQGKDIIGQAQTGTGKTAAFGIPLVETTDVGNEQIQGLVITPTRELAMQVAEELNKIGQFKRTRALPIYGGQDIDRQIKALKKKPHIIVATPGRLIDHMKRRTIRLASVKMVILDEADEMLNMGFIEDIEEILQGVPQERQTLLFSATMPKPIQSLAQRFMKEPELVAVTPKEITVPNIEQQYIEVPEKQKFDTLCRLLDIHTPELALIFGRTKQKVDEMAEVLSKRGYGAEAIHGDINQNRRNAVLKRFKEGEIEVLVATDVAARGLDISGISHVYNFDIPQDPESYVHRIGRTGRAGNRGIAITLVTPREIGYLRTIEKLTKRKMERKPIPTMTEALEGMQRSTIEKLISVIEQGHNENFKGLAEKLLEEHDSVTLVSAALKLITKEPNKISVKLPEEPTPQVKREQRGRKNQTLRGKIKKAKGGKNKRGNEVYHR